MRKILRYVAIFVCLLLNGCLSKGDIFNHQSLSGSSITTMDARQRSILANNVKGINSNPTFLRMCAEPFPDIFTVISSSLSAGLDAEASADQGKIASAKIGAQIAQALKESGASIDRSQTVNLLNMSLYRTCERYMNGIIDEKELKIQAFRDQQAMVSILAIEQLTNLARPAPTKIILDSGFAEANTTIANSNQSVKNTLIKATEEYEKALKLKEEELKNSKQKVKCDFDDTTQQKECDDAAINFNAASQAFIQAQMEYNKTSATSTSTGAQAGSAQSTNIVINDNRKPDGEFLNYHTVKHIADTVLELAKLGTKFDCHQYLAINDPSSQSFRKCDGTDKPDGAEVAIDKSDKVATLKAKECNLKDSEIKFYVQAKKNCDECEKKAEESKVALNTILHKRCERLVSYPIEFMDKDSMPNNNEIRYFDDDKPAAEEIAAKLGVKAKQFNIKSSPHVIEYWVGKNN